MVAHWDWVLAHFRLPIARALREAGAEVVLVSPPGDSVARFTDESFRWVPWRVDRSSMAPHREAIAVTSLARIYRRERPDVVHHYTIKPSLYGTLAGRMTGVGTIVNVFSGLGFVFGDDRNARLLRRTLLPVMRAAFRSDRVWLFALNEEDLEALRTARLARPDRSALLPEGVDTDRFTPPSDVVERDVPVVLLACRLLSDKGVPELVQAATILRDRGVAVDIRIAGAADSGNPRSITDEQYERWQAEAPVDFLGARSDLHELLRETDIAVLPTHYKEGLPWFLLEAGATAVPLIATDVPGCRDVVQHGRTGLLVPPRDPFALAAAIAELAQDATRRAALGRAARQLVLNDHSERHVQREHVRLYRGFGVLA